MVLSFLTKTNQIYHPPTILANVGDPFKPGAPVATYIKLAKPGLGAPFAWSPPDPAMEHRALEGERLVLAVLTARVGPGFGDFIDEALVDDSTNPEGSKPLIGCQQLMALY